MRSKNKVITVDLPSTRPYLIRALHEWCNDNGFTPHIAVVVDQWTRVPREFVRDGQIVLNVGYEATGHLQIGNDLITFQARFGGVAKEISVPIGNVVAIYARGNGVGMSFEAEKNNPSAEAQSVSTSADDGEPEPTPPAGRPRLQRIK